MGGQAFEPRFRCAGCGTVVGAVASPFACPRARDRDDVDHVLVPVPLKGTSWPPAPGSPRLLDHFSSYRPLLSAWHLARFTGMGDDEYRDLAVQLDGAIAALDGAGFHVTPCLPQERLAASLGFEDGGELRVKDETGNVSGSHKARHLMGVMLYLLVAERAGLADHRAPLALASCGNAALAAAVTASAANWPLEVFVPPSARPEVLERLQALGARVTICRREAGATGDPCYLAFRRALDEGALPFCCQGSDNGLTIEGGQTIAWEMIEQVAGGSWELSDEDGERPPPKALDAIVVQVGGGALASSIVRGYAVARRLGAVEAVPAIYAVQTSNAHPLVRAYERVTARAARTDPDEAILYARRHRSEFMWPWEEEPTSIAHGILDDETYDWAAVVEGLLRTGGRAVTVSERRLEEANELARSLTGIDVDHTGSAGLAGLMDLLAAEPALRRARVAVIFSGIRR